MEVLTDVAFLSRLQFALTVAFHFIFVPMSIGIGLILAVTETRYYKSRDPKDEAASWLWTKIFTTTFVIGVATGITMEFSFGTNWANYSRFVGDIFGAPLAAEALFAFFLESTFLGIVLFGRKKVGPKLYLVSTWLVWLGSCLSALWILIANSWMQTPAGAELSADGSKAVLTDFFAAAFNASTGERYFHTVLSLLVMGGFIAMAVAAVYLRRGTHRTFAERTLKTGVAVALVCTCALMVSAHATAKQVTEEQPTKIAMMEGAYNTESLPMYVVGYVDQETGEVHAPIAIPGMTSWLASGDASTEYPGLLELAEQNPDLDVSSMPVNATFVSYHVMICLMGLIALLLLLGLFAAFKKNSRLRNARWWQTLTIVSPLVPFAAIQAGWMTAEVGRQPYVVYPATSSPAGVKLLTNDAISMSVSSTELWITIILFILVYLLLFIAWIRLVRMQLAEGPLTADEREERRVQRKAQRAAKKAAHGHKAAAEKTAAGESAVGPAPAAATDAATSSDTTEGE